VAWRAGAAGAGIVLILAGCAGREAPDAVYRSSKSYRVALPGPDWGAVSASRADVELRHREAPAAILTNASCGPRLASHPIESLRREILAGFSGRDVQLHEAVSVGGREGTHMIVDGWVSRPDALVRVELFVLRGDRCVYDLVYAAPPGDFARWQAEFQRLVASFS